MTQRELVSSYLQGQIGRRAFLRRLVESGVSLAAAMVYVRALGTDPAEATHDGAPDEYPERRLIKVTSGGLQPARPKVPRGGLVQWDFEGTIEGAPGSQYYTRRYKVTDPLDFLPWTDLNSGHRARRFFAAGTFSYSVQVWTRDESGSTFAGTFAGKIRALVQASKTKVPQGASPRLSWASRTAPAGRVYDVQRKTPGGSFTMWKHGVTASGTKVKLTRKGTYAFRARLRRTSDGKSSGWSPGRTIRVV